MTTTLIETDSTSTTSTTSESLPVSAPTLMESASAPTMSTTRESLPVSAPTLMESDSTPTMSTTIESLPVSAPTLMESADDNYIDENLKLKIEINKLNDKLKENTEEIRVLIEEKCKLLDDVYNVIAKFKSKDEIIANLKSQVEWADLLIGEYIDNKRLRDAIRYQASRAR